MTIKVLKDKPWEGQICDIWGSSDKVEITKVRLTPDGKPEIEGRLMEGPNDDQGSD